MGLGPTQGDEKRVGPAPTLYGTVALSLSSRPERSGAEGPAVLRTLLGNVFRRSEADLSRRAVEGSAVRHSGAPNLPFYSHFPFVIPREADRSRINQK